MQIRFMFDTEKDDFTDLRMLLTGNTGVKTTARRSRRKDGEIAGIRKILDKLPAYMDVSKLTVHEAAEILVFTKPICHWLKQLNDKVESALKQGEVVDGWKLVHRDKKRCLSSNAAALRRLQKIGLKRADAIENYMVISLSKLETDFGADAVQEALGDLIYVPEGELVVVPVSDKRAGVSVKKGV